MKGYWGWLDLSRYKKSLYLAAVASFKPKSILLSSVYSTAVYNNESETTYKFKEQTF